MRNAVVVFSGGPDSTASALWAAANNINVELLTFQYKGAEQYGEIRSSIIIAQLLKMKHTIIDFKSTMASFSPMAHIMMHAGTPEGNSKSESSHLMPFGAGMVLSIAANYAVYNSINTMIWGATKDDGYDNNYQYRKEFADDLAFLISKAIGSTFEIITPFNDLHKHQVMRAHFIGREQIFSNTWSCKKGLSEQSGDCEASIARRVAAQLAGLNDLTVYKNEELIWPSSLPSDKSSDDIDPAILAGIFKSPRMPMI